MRIGVVNQSKKLTDRSQVLLMVNACGRQAREHAATPKAWDRSPPILTLYNSLQQVPKDTRLMVLLDAPDVADALGYHSETPDGRPYGKVFINPILQSGGNVLDGVSSVSVTLSHEVLEMWIDPNVNGWFDGPSEQEYSAEVCDPVEADAYPITESGRKVWVSNFVLPPYFDTNPAPDETKFDHLGRLKKPFSMTDGGYLIYRKADGTVEEIFGSLFPEWKKTGKKHAAARSSRRLKKK